MKQNMCVTIDEEIHSWLKKKNEMMSRLVNRILWKAMQKEIQQRALKSGEQSQLPLKPEVSRYCPSCDLTQTSRDQYQTFCVTRACVNRGQPIEVVE